MKKFLLAIASVAMTCGFASAEEVTLDVNDAQNIDGTLVEATSNAAKHYQPLNSLSIGNFNFTFAGEGNNKAAYYYPTASAKDQNNTIRMYNGNTMTITAPAGTEITQIAFKGTNGKADAKPSVTTGTISVSGTTEMTWTGAAPAITITYDNTFRIRTMAITTGVSTMETLDMPVFNPVSGTSFEDQLAVTITAQEGSTIYYTLDGTNPTKESTVYSAPIAITSTTTVKAFAAKEGMNDSGVASATYTKDEVMASFEDLINAGLEDEKTEFTYTGKAVVTYQNGQNLYVRDNTAAMLIFGTLDKVYENGDVISGFKGTFKNYYSTWELMANKNSFADATETAEAEPVEFTIPTITPNDQNQYIILKNVTIDGETVKSGSDEIPMYNKFKVEIPTTTEPQDVVGIISYYQQKGAEAAALQIYPISFKKATGIDNIAVENDIRVEGNNIIAPANAEVYSISGVRVNANGLNNGVYVVRVNGNAVKVLVK